MYLLLLFPIWFCQQKIYSVTSSSDGLKNLAAKRRVAGCNRVAQRQGTICRRGQGGHVFDTASPSLGSGASPVLSLKNTSERGRGCDL